MNSLKDKNIELLILAAALIFVGGCGEGEDTGPEPTTHAVKGTVHHADGKPLFAGMVEFKPVKDGHANGFGTVEDGKFTLTMMLNGKKYTGVPQGEYQVAVIPRGATEEQQGDPEYIMLPAPITIEAKAENDLKLVLPKKK